MDAPLRYRGNIPVEDLDVGDCTIHRAGDAKGRRWWLLWCRVLSDVAQAPMDFAVPVNPLGPYLAEGAGGKTWAMQPLPSVPGTWGLAPSVNVLDTRELHDGDHEDRPSLWHHMVAIEGVADTEIWTDGRAP